MLDTPTGNGKRVITILFHFLAFQYAIRICKCPTGNPKREIRNLPTWKRSPPDEIACHPLDFRANITEVHVDVTEGQESGLRSTGKSKLESHGRKD